MPLDRFLIAPYATGLQQNLKPWLILDDAFQELNNCRAWRGRIKKRFGSTNMNMSVSQSERQLFSRLRLKIGTTNGAGDFGPIAVPGIIWKVGQILSVGVVIYTVYLAGNNPTLSTGIGIATFDTATGTFTLVGGPALADVYFYPAEPVMLLPTLNGKNVSNEQLIGFDTQFSYKFVKALGWDVLGPLPPVANSATWTGNNSDFHNIANWRGVSAGTYLLFVVNGVIADQVKYYDSVANTWTSFQPVYNLGTGFVVRTAKIVVQFKNRLVLMATTEQTGAGNILFQNRIRWSKLGSPIDADSWYDDPQFVLGNFLDATINEAITGAEFIRDRLIIYMESSTWELVDTANEAFPFQLQQINTVLGVESTNSIVPFDKQALGFGSTGVHACNGTNVDRIDSRIPNNIFDIQNENAGPQRTTGIKDYFTQEVYWSYPSAQKVRTNAEVFPNNVLVYSYETQSWSNNDDSITAFGYYQNEGALVWRDLTYAWEESEDTWNDPSLISLFRNVVAGNQEGWTFIIDPERNANALSLSITNITTADNSATLVITDHNLKVGDFIYIQNIVGTTGINDGIYRVNTVTNVNTITIVVTGATGTYLGGGTVGLVSRIGLISKQYNFYNKDGKKLNIPRVDFLLSKTSNGQLFFDYNTSFSNTSLSQDSINISSATGNNILESKPYSTFESSQTMLWRSLFPFAEGLVIQYQLYFNDALMVQPTVVWSEFELHAVLFYARPTSDLGF